MKKIKLEKFETVFENKITFIDFTYKTGFGTAKITVTFNKDRMSSGDFHFTDAVGKSQSTDSIIAMSEKVRTEAISFAEKLREFLLFS